MYTVTIGKGLDIAVFNQCLASHTCTSVPVEQVDSVYGEDTRTRVELVAVAVVVALGTERLLRDVVLTTSRIVDVDR